MATITKSQNFIMITAIAADVEPVDIFKDSEPRKIKRIEFKGGADDDICVIKENAAAGAVISNLTVGDVNLVDRCYFDDGGQYMRPFIDFSDCTLNAGHQLILELA